MNLIYLLIIVFVASTSAINNDIQSLESWIKKAENKLESIGDPFQDFIRLVNKTCIKESKINLNRNGHKQVNFPEAMIAIYGAGMECFEERTKTSLWNLMINTLAASYKKSINKENIKCFKKEFQRVKTNNYIVDDKPIQLTPRETKFCENLVDDIGLQSHIKYLENIFGTSLLTLTCNTTKNEDIKKLFLSVIVISGQDIDQYGLIGALANEFKDRLKKAYGCVMNRIKNYQNYEPRVEEVTEKTQTMPAAQPFQSTQINPGYEQNSQNYQQFNFQSSHASGSASTFSQTNRNPGPNYGANMSPIPYFQMNPSYYG